MHVCMKPIGVQSKYLQIQGKAALCFKKNKVKEKLNWCAIRITEAFEENYPNAEWVQKGCYGFGRFANDFTVD